MWWTLIALLSGSYADMVRDPAEMRFCAAASQQVEAETAKARGAQSDEVRMHRLITEAFVARLRELGAADDAALAATRKALGNSEEDQTRYSRCGTLAMALSDDGSLVKAAAEADAAVAEAIATAPQYDADASSAADAAAEAEAAAEAVSEEAIDGDALLAALSEPRRGEVRCATIASALMYDVGRGVSDKSYGLTAESAETLAGRLAEVIMTETGMSEAEVRAAYKADFEAFTFGMLGDGQDEKTALAMVEAGVEQCRPLYDSIDLSGEGDGVVTALTPVAMLDGEAPPTTAQCYAMLAAFHRDMTDGSKEAESFGAMTAALVKRFYREWGDRPGAAAALADAAQFDAAAFEALSEEQAETRMSFCMDLAGA